MSRKSSSRRKARKSRNRSRGSLLDRPPRERVGAFQAKARSGDAAQVQFSFSGVLVPVRDEATPEAGLAEKTACQKALAARTPRTLH